VLLINLNALRITVIDKQSAGRIHCQRICSPEGPGSLVPERERRRQVTRRSEDRDGAAPPVKNIEMSKCIERKVDRISQLIPAACSAILRSAFPPRFSMTTVFESLSSNTNSSRPLTISLSG
jgi:hypothetical protein